MTIVKHCLSKKQKWIFPLMHMYISVRPQGKGGYSVWYLPFHLQLCPSDCQIYSRLHIMRACEKGNKTPNGLTWINAQTLQITCSYSCFPCLPCLQLFTHNLPTIGVMQKHTWMFTWHGPLRVYFCTTWSTQW